MHPKNPQMSEGDKLERANNTLLRHRGPGKPNDKKAKALFDRNMGEHAVRTMKVKDVIKEYKEDPEAYTAISAESIGRMRRGEPSKYHTDKDL